MNIQFMSVFYGNNKKREGKIRKKKKTHKEDRHTRIEYKNETLVNFNLYPVEGINGNTYLIGDSNNLHTNQLHFYSIRSIRSFFLFLFLFLYCSKSKRKRI